MNFNSQAVPKLNNKISCLLPMVVITVPAKKKELPKSQWLIWLEVFPKGIIPAFIAATICCKFKKKFISTHESHGGINTAYIPPQTNNSSKSINSKVYSSISSIHYRLKLYTKEFNTLNYKKSLFDIKRMDLHKVYHIVLWYAFIMSSSTTVSNLFELTTKYSNKFNKHLRVKNIRSPTTI